MDRRSESILVDVAKEAGISLAIVSKVPNNHGYLSQAIKDRVIRAIKALGYRPNQVARALHGERTHTIGLIIPAVALPFFSEIAIVVKNALTGSDYRVLICSSLGRSDRERDCPSLPIGSRADGIISGAHNEDLEGYQSICVPIVAIDRSLSPRIPNVYCDNKTEGRLATERPSAGGSRRPALLTSRSHGLSLHEWGYRITCETADIEPIAFEVPFHTAPANRPVLMTQCLDGVVRVIDSVFATDDLAAAGVLEWAYQRDLLVPEQLRVIGLDRTVAVRRVLPTSATIRQPIEDMAREAVRLLLGGIGAVNPALLEGGVDIPKIGEIVELPVELLESSVA